MADLPLLLDAQDVVEVDAGNGGEGRAFAGRRNRETGVVGGQADLAKEGVRRLDIGYAGKRERVDEPILQRPEGALRSPPRIGRSEERPSSTGYAANRPRYARPRPPGCDPGAFTRCSWKCLTVKPW